MLGFLHDFVEYKLCNKYLLRKYNRQNLYLRKQSVDQNVYDSVFLEKFHQPFKQINNKVPVILDLGSNIGLTIIDLKMLYPYSTIYAYELDKDNYDLSVFNCKHLSGCHIHNQAIWVESTRIQYNKNADSDAYKIELDDKRFGQTTICDSVTINQIVDKYKLKSIDYVKMDIEGAELEVFQKNLEWLNITTQIKIEVHGGPELFNFLQSKLLEFRFDTVKDTHHWSTLIGYKSCSFD